LKLSNSVKLPLLWLKRWQSVDPFWHVFHLQGTIYREQPGRKTLRFIEENEPYFVKCHFGVGWKEIFKNLLQGRLPILGAKNEFLAIERLKKFGFVPEVVGYGWRGINPANQQSFLITKELSFTISLEDFCHDWPFCPSPLKLKWALIRKLADIARNIHEQGVNHRDFYLCHFLLDITGGSELLDPKELHIYLIDLHRAQLRKKVPWRWRVKDIAGLYFSAMDLGLTQHDLWRFIMTYNSGKPLRFWRAVRKRAIKLYRKIWRRLSHDIRLPFYFTLSNQKHFYAKALLRVLPGKRMTLLGEWEQQEVVAKLFKFQRNIQAELQGYAALVKNEFATPKLLYHDWSQHQALYVLIYAYHKNAMSLKHIFEQANLGEKQTWLRKLVTLLQQHHDKGLWQADCHLNNFIVDQNELLTIDLGSIRSQEKPLSKQQRNKNLAFLFSQFAPEESLLWEPYATPAINKIIKAIRANLLKKFLEKSQRSCTTYRCEKSRNYCVVLNRQYDNAPMRQWIKHIIEKNEINMHQVNIKSFHHKKLFNYFLSPARLAWRELHQHLFNKESKLIPIALIEKKYCGLITQSYLVFADAAE
jgi:heptose I phosphotransferase